MNKRMDLKLAAWCAGTTARDVKDLLAIAMATNPTECKAWIADMRRWRDYLAACGWTPAVYSTYGRVRESLERDYGMTPADSKAMMGLVTPVQMVAITDWLVTVRSPAVRAVGEVADNIVRLAHGGFVYGRFADIVAAGGGKKWTKN